MVKSFAQDRISWLGHDGFLIDGTQKLYFDPYQIDGGSRADIICITHEHFDHCSPEDVAKVQGPDTVIVTEAQCKGKLSGDVRVMKPGDTLEVKGVHIHAVASYNTNKDFHPRKNAWLGFVVKMDGVRIYHAGDTDFIPEMKDLEVDIALLPVSGTYVMTADEAVKAALAINPKLAIPMHYGAIVGDKQDARTFKDSLEGKIDVLILEKD
ncbi:MAG: MBL fold metallo-hydrolase [Thermodesulfobacteriota bacterium]